MAKFSDSENQLLERITNDRFHTSLGEIREAMEDIWAVDAPRIIQDFTDHGKEHCERLAFYAVELLKANTNTNGDRSLSDDEMYLLLAGIYLHDIGMQCDVVECPGIKKKAEELGANFDASFTAETSSSYSLEEQKMIRSNHHYLSAAWIDYARSTGETVLGHAAKKIRADLVEDVMDVCMYHSKLSIRDCDEEFSSDPTGRKKLTAAILRLSDELDIESSRVNIETVMNFRLDPDNGIYWWLHNQTKVIFLTTYVIEIIIMLHPNDEEKYSDTIKSIFIDGFEKKNKELMHILRINGFQIALSNDCKVQGKKFRDTFPSEIAQVLQAMQQKDEEKQRIIPIPEEESKVSSKNLFGRGENIKRALDLLERDSFAIVGIKGIGKSKLLSALFEKVTEDGNFQFKVHYWRRFSYGEPPSFSDFGRRLIKDLDNEDPVEFDVSKVEGQVEKVIDVLNEKQCLLVIDQFEAVIDRETRRPKDQGFAQFLTCVKDKLKTARLVITAWEVPNDLEERQFPHILLKGVDESAGIDIIRNKISEKDRQALDKSIEDVKRLIRDRLQGHPKTLELIAVYLLDNIDKIQKDNLLSKGKLEEIPSYVVSKAYTGISKNPNLKKALSSLCIFPRPCDVGAISYVSDMSDDETSQALDELTNRSLASRFQEETYDVHALVREYVLNQLSENEKYHFHDKAASFYLKQPCLPLENRKSIKDIYHFLEAINHLISANKPEDAGTLFIKEEIHDQLYCWSYFMELVDIYKHFENNNIPKSMLSIFLGNYGLVLRDLGELKEAKEYYEKALSIARDCQDRNSECAQLVNLGDLHHYLGEIDQSIEFHNKAKDLFKEIKNRKLEARNFGCLGNALISKKDLQRAEKYYSQAIAVCREVGDRRYEGIWIGDLGIVYAEQDDYTRAIEYYEKAHAIAIETKDRRDESLWLGILGNIYHRLEDFPKAIYYLENALSIAESIVFRRGIHSHLRSFGNIFSSSGEYLKAIDYIKKALNISREMKSAENMISDLWTIGVFYFDLREFHQSIIFLEEALDIDRENGKKKYEGDILSKIGESYSQLGEFENATDYISKAIFITKEKEYKSDEINYISQLVIVYVNSCQLDKALKCFIQADNIAVEIGGDQYKDSLHSLLKGRIEPLNKNNNVVEPLLNKLTKARENSNIAKEMKALCSLGDIYTLLIQFKKAEEYYCNALEIAKKTKNRQHESIIFYKLGNICFFLKQINEAIDYYKQAIAISKETVDPKSEKEYSNQLSEAYLAEAQQLCEDGQIETALEKYRKVIEMNPAFTKTYEKIGDAYLKLGKLKAESKFYDLGIKNYTRAIEIKPTNSLYRERANCYAYKRHLEKSISDYHEAIKLNPNDITAIVDKMEIEIWLGLYSEARATYKNLHGHSLAPEGKLFAAFLICLVLSLDGIPYEDYMTSLEDMTIKTSNDYYNPKDIEPCISKLKDSEIPQDRSEHALMIYELFKKHYIPEKDINKLKQAKSDADALYKEENFKKSAEKYTEVLEIDSTSAYAYSQRGICYKILAYSSKDPEKCLNMAIQDSTEAIKLEPRNDSNYMMRAGYYSQKGDLANSIPDYRRAAKINPLNKSAFLGKIEVEICLRRYNEAIATYKRLILGTISDKEKVVAASLICISLALDGNPYKDYIDPLNDMEVKLSDKLDWGTVEIDRNLAELEKEGFYPNRVAKAKKIQSLFKKHFTSQ